ncbi:class I SAM-dependent methyltransferase [Halocalculus aciditolerans]|uniref:Methyltransferase type 11 n=1 Tax=Halocalculus aciditolerans TaxID=1383812 RepID=A0A830FD10_9EURY|nr:class I SAM-dependent methyltransferase [Halocalculus aciditolerans]GGL62952.1 methyltransferase type 11 [Halocalculus aciditolerans]
MTGDDEADAAFRRAVRSGYDSLADAYAAQRDAGDDSPDLLDSLFDDLGAGARVLDLGCGAGDLVLDSLPDPVRGVGLDVSREQTRRARTHADRVVQGDMTALPFDADSFDAATAMYSIIHVPASEHPAVYAELARVLRPGGDAVVVTGHDAWTGANPDWLDANVEMRWSWPALAETKRALREAGLEVVEEADVADSLGGSFRHLRLSLDA